MITYCTPETDNTPGMDDFAKMLVEGIKQHGVALTGEGGLLTNLTRQVLQTALEVEMQASWEEFSPFLKFEPEVRKVI